MQDPTTFSGSRLLCMNDLVLPRLVDWNPLGMHVRVQMWEIPGSKHCKCCHSWEHRSFFWCIALHPYPGIFFMSTCSTLDRRSCTIPCMWNQ
ncbi:hypothetical protein PAXRUDRAFT_584226 [Paxillus rubicundulus Ve08.2h10]|uniref:Uncharacterized protein n=1 Tax=Paxillus rubicundulus Ve08.2h10 TaxID=930991 RepID=A0A0D0DZA5_9AGAM|nr:hypothetical protein PAXRUDRAFT_584226 [Paxillus rubicundulus Ve08.2h10]